MSTHTFTLILEGPSELTPALEDAAFRAGCDDAALGFRGSAIYLEFDREAPSFREALLSAVRDAQAIQSVRVARVEPDELVTASEIAERTGRSREGVRLLVEGERGPGGFPSPVSGTATRRTRLWRWSEVSEWLGRTEIASTHTADAHLIAAANGALDLIRNATEDAWPEILAAVGAPLEA
jgi:hypothetical protein